MTIMRRLQNATFEMAASANRFAGSGGGSGISGGGMRQLGVSGSVTNQNFASTSFAAITGTTVTFLIGPGVTGVLFSGFLTGKVTAGANNGLFLISVSGPGGYSNSSGAVYNGLSSYATLYCYLRDSLATPGQYTAQFQAAVDVGGTTFNVPGNSTVLEVIGLGS